MALIYCIEDDESIRELVVYALNSNGFETIGFENGENIEYENADLIILDIMLPGEDGISILKRLKNSSSTMDIPVIMLTAKVGELNTVKALDLGADDYIEKPFGIIELISRVKAVLRRTKKDSNILSYKNILLDSDKHKVNIGEDEIILTNKEFQLLEYFLINQGIVLSRSKLLEDIWGFDYEGETRTIDVHIRSLRLKLKSEGKHIKTVINVGYKLGD